ncbi:MAG TPA: glycosyltransferase family 4 protein, partial [Thermoanaerobaculia bacterium]|nr:glycosyltransferase family 4 protein [Thermoanaerobaculia bacterium]
KARGYRPAGRILALENPLPESFLGRPLDLERGPEIGYCGSWLPIKGIEVIRREIPGVLNAFPGWRFTLVGVGASFRAADHFPADILPRISVVPVANRERELPELYRRFAILIAPSLSESFGLATAEAMACGAAVAATPVGFAAALVEDEEVVSIDPPGEPGRLADAVGRLIRDPELRRRVATGGWKRVQELRWDRAADRLAAAYEGWAKEIRTVWS